MSGIPGDDDHAWSTYPASRTAMEQAEAAPPSPQTQTAAFRLAFADRDFLARDETRPLRLAMELMKPELMQAEAGIRSTVVVFGSARVKPDTRWYEAARQFAFLVTEAGHRGRLQDFAVVTGGGPGIM